MELSEVQKKEAHHDIEIMANKYLSHEEKDIRLLALCALAYIHLVRKKDEEN